MEYFKCPQKHSATVKTVTDSLKYGYFKAVWKKNVCLETKS